MSDCARARTVQVIVQRIHSERASGHRVSCLLRAPNRCHNLPKLNAVIPLWEHIKHRESLVVWYAWERATLHNFGTIFPKPPGLNGLGGCQSSLCLHNRGQNKLENCPHYHIRDVSMGGQGYRCCHFTEWNEQINFWVAGNFVKFPLCLLNRVLNIF